MKHDTSIASNDLYEASLRAKRGPLRQLLLNIWQAVAITAMIAIAWAEPWSAMLFKWLLAAGVAPWLVNYVGVALVMALRAVLLAEAAGYAFHRFCQHVGFLTRTAQWFRRGQKYHWLHHMIIYPIGRFYRRAGDYKSSEKGFGLSWVLPAVLVAGLFLFTHGFHFATFAFLGFLAFYLIKVVDLTHARFHNPDHKWMHKRYFLYLDKMHLLHHWDQRTNFTIVLPFMDLLFGTYLSPKGHEKELNLAIEDEELTVSDMINWRYLLVEATPAERAAFVSSVQKDKRGARKVGKLIQVLKDRMAAHPEDANACDLHQKALDLLQLCGKMDLLGKDDDSAS